MYAGRRAEVDSASYSPWDGKLSVGLCMMYQLLGLFVTNAMVDVDDSSLQADSQSQAKSVSLV